jgi:hypothetical protein
MSNFSTHALAYTSCNENIKLLPTPSVSATSGNMAQYVSSQVGGKPKEPKKTKEPKKMKKSKKTKKRRTNKRRTTLHRLRTSKTPKK